ncbi:MAG: DUF177 domain-containing protein [Candidatus Omnitrophota bacterium]|nr:DUF177 domain-containing protein [Candidatus Omnitrophota bacterium]
MKIRVDDIQEGKELAVDGDIDVSEWKIDNSDVKFLDSIHLKGRAQRISKEILLYADIVIHWKINCFRCLEDSEQVLNQSYTLTYDADSVGEYLEVDNDIREEILLNFPMKLLCAAECKGICSKCGANLNEERCRCCKGG